MNDRMFRLADIGDVEIDELPFGAIRIDHDVPDRAVAVFQPRAEIVDDGSCGDVSEHFICHARFALEFFQQMSEVRICVMA